MSLQVPQEEWGKVRSELDKQALLAKWRENPRDVAKHRKAWHQHVAEITDVPFEVAYRMWKDGYWRPTEAEVITDICNGEAPERFIRDDVWSYVCMLKSPGVPIPIRTVADGYIVGPVDDGCELLTVQDNEKRKGRITGSVVPLICLGDGEKHVEAYQRVLQLKPFADNVAKRMGRRLEDPCREEYLYQHPGWLCELTGTVVHPDEGWAACSPDGIVLTGGPAHGLEIKNRHYDDWRDKKDDGWGRAWTDEVPQDVRYQCQWGMWVFGLNRWDVILGGTRFTTYMLHRDDALIADMVEQCRDFYDWHIAMRRMPR